MLLPWATRQVWLCFYFAGDKSEQSLLMTTMMTHTCNQTARLSGSQGPSGRDGVGAVGCVCKQIRKRGRPLSLPDVTLIQLSRFVLLAVIYQKKKVHGPPANQWQMSGKAFTWVALNNKRFIMDSFMKPLQSRLIKMQFYQKNVLKSKEKKLMRGKSFDSYPHHVVRSSKYPHYLSCFRVLVYWQ